MGLRRGRHQPPPPAPDWVGWVIGAVGLVLMAWFYASNAPGVH